MGNPPRLNETRAGHEGTLGEVGAKVGGTAVLRCPLDAHPSPGYVWRFNGVGFDLRNERWLVSEDGTLVVRDVREYEFGRYQCVARNSIGTAIYEIDLMKFRKLVY